MVFPAVVSMDGAGSFIAAAFQEPHHKEEHQPKADNHRPHDHTVHFETVVCLVQWVQRSLSGIRFWVFDRRVIGERTNHRQTTRCLRNLPPARSTPDCIISNHN